MWVVLVLARCWFAAIVQTSTFHAFPLFFFSPPPLLSLLAFTRFLKLFRRRLSQISITQFSYSRYIFHTFLKLQLYHAWNISAP